MMTDFTRTLAEQADSTGRMPPGLVVVASQQEIEQLRSLDAAGSLADARLVPLAAGEPVPADLLDEMTLLVIEVDPAVPASLDRISSIRAERRSLPIIAALRGMDVSMVRTLLRQGVADVVDLPLNPLALAASVAEAASAMPAAGDGQPLAPMISIVGAVGGCGTTTIITHLAAQFAQKRNLHTCVVDLDVQAGEVAYYVGKSPRVTVETLLTAGQRLDADFVRSALIDSGHGFSLIAAPERVMPLDDVEVDGLLALLRLLRQEFDLVIIDLPTDWTNWALSAVNAASDLVLVTELSLACLRQARRRLDLFASVGVPAERVKLLANRVERGLFKSVDLADAEKALGSPFVGSIVDVGHEMVEAQDEGALLTDVQRRTKFEAQVSKLADALLGKPD